MRINEEEIDIIDGGYEDDFVMGEDIETDDYAEVEMEIAEPTKLTDVDGSVVIATPGDIVTIKSESIKRFSK